MHRRRLLSLLVAAPAIAAAACRPAEASTVLSYDAKPSERVGNRSWYIDRLAEQVLNGAAVCTRDNGALFEFCRSKHAEGVFGQPEAFSQKWGETRTRLFGRDPITNTRQYIYWPVPRKRADRLAIMQGLRAAAWRDEGFGRLPDDTFIQPAIVMAGPATQVA